MKKLLAFVFLLGLASPSYAALKAVSNTPNASNAVGVLPVANGGTGTSELGSTFTPTSDSTAGASIAIGSSALSGQTSSAAYENTAIGYRAIGNGTLTTAAINNTALGYTALQALTSGYENTAVGNIALQANTTGNNNNAFGWDALTANIGGGANNCYGNASCSAAVSVSSMACFGDGACQDTTTASTPPTAVGAAALQLATTSTGDTAIGYFSQYHNLTGTNNTSLGANSLYTATAATNDTGVGIAALQLATGGSNTAVGANAGSAVSTGTNNTLIGANVGNGGLAMGSYNTLIGGDNTTKTESSSSSNALAIGYGAVAGTDDVSVGFQTLGAETSNGLFNTALGYKAGHVNAGGGSNTYLGYETGLLVTSGANNTIIGAGVGSTTLASGAGNILIGTNSGVDVGTAGTSDTLNIGNLIYGTGLATSGTTPSGTVAIGTASPHAGIALDMGSTTGAALLPVGTTGQEPASPAVGEIRYNSTTNAFEGYQGATPAWSALGGGGGGGIPPVVGTAANLSGGYVSTTTATWTSDQLVVATSLGGTAYNLSNYSQTLTLTSSGAGGMDVGSAPASGWIYVYAIYDPTSSTSSILATISCASCSNLVEPNVYGGTHMPSGYTASALIGVLYLNSSSQFVQFHQIGRTIYSQQQTALNGAASASTTTVSPTAIVPPIAKSWGGNIAVTGSSLGTIAGVEADSASAAGGVYVNNISSSYALWATASGVPISTTQTITWYSGNASNNFYIFISSFSF